MFKKQSVYLVFLCLIILPVALFSQSDKSSVSLSVGLSVPQDQFADKIIPTSDTAANPCGFAQKGISFKLDYTYHFSDNFGINAMFLGSSNSVDTKALGNEMTERFGEPIGEIKVAGDNWSTGGLILGPNINFYINRQLRLNVRGGVGFYSGYSPEIVYGATFESGEREYYASYKRQKSNATAFAWALGGNLQYYFSDMFVLVSIDWVDSKLDFKNVNYQTKLKETNEIVNYSTSYSTTIDVLSYSVGVGVRF